MSRLNGYILPIELIQATLLLLDIDSFYLASLTCGLWRDVALSAHILRCQLKAVPAGVLPRSLLDIATTPYQLRSLFRDVCRHSLIGVRSKITYQSAKSKSQRTSHVGDIPIRSHRQGLQFARLQRLALSLHGSAETTKARDAQLSPAIYPSPDAVPQVWSHNYSQRVFRGRASARFQVAISKCGDLVAVELEQKIHIYLLQSGKVVQMRYAEAEVSERILDSIQSLEFTDNDEFI
ncbi:hypothetical protein BDV12DRAFT_199757 [Aspergillus spectabilis]